MSSVNTNRRQGVNSGAAIKVPVRVATTANITLSGLQTIDGVTVVADDRVLVKDQTTQSQNGIYVASSSTWQRALDFDGQFDVKNGTLVHVNEGTVNGSAIWRIDTPDSITIGSSSISFSRGANTSGIDPIDQTVVNAKGDLLVATGADAVDRFAVGTDNHVLFAQSSQTSGVMWADVNRAVLSLGQCRLTFSGANSLILSRHNGRYLFINGLAETIPASGVSLTNGGLSASTLYYIYAFMSSGSMTLEASTTASAVDSTYGHRIKSGDATRSLVGRVFTNSSAEFTHTPSYTSATGVRSWFNPIHYVRSDVVFFQWPVGDTSSVPDSGGAFTTLGNAVSAGYWLQVPFNMTAKIEHARFSVVWATSNVGNKVRLQYADDGPANIVGIVDIASDGGGTPIHSSSDVTTTLQNLQVGFSVFKHLGVQYAKVNATSFTLYRIWLEVLWSLGDSF